MALILPTLETGLATWLDPQATSPAESAIKFGDAYKNFARTAQAGTLLPLPPALEIATQALVGTMTGVNSVGVPASFCVGIANALVAFWATPGIFPGALVVAIPATLATSLSSVLVSGMAGANTEVIAKQIALLIYTWMITPGNITTTIAAPPLVVPSLI